MLNPPFYFIPFVNTLTVALSDYSYNIPLLQLLLELISVH